MSARTDTQETECQGRAVGLGGRECTAARLHTSLQIPHTHTHYQQDTWVRQENVILPLRIFIPKVCIYVHIHVHVRMCIVLCTCTCRYVCVFIINAAVCMHDLIPDSTCRLSRYNLCYSARHEVLLQCGGADATGADKDGADHGTSVHTCMYIYVQSCMYIIPHSLLSLCVSCCVSHVYTFQLVPSFSVPK